MKMDVFACHMHAFDSDKSNVTCIIFYTSFWLGGFGIFEMRYAHLSHCRIARAHRAIFFF